MQQEGPVKTPAASPALLRAVEYVRMSTEHQQYSTENQADKTIVFVTAIPSSTPLPRLFTAPAWINRLPSSPRLRNACRGRDGRRAAVRRQPEEGAPRTEQVEGSRGCVRVDRMRRAVHHAC